jgi:hypothetical protein
MEEGLASLGILISWEVWKEKMPTAFETNIPCMRWCLTSPCWFRECLMGMFGWCEPRHSPDGCRVLIPAVTREILSSSASARSLAVHTKYHLLNCLEGFLPPQVAFFFQDVRFVWLWTSSRSSIELTLLCTPRRTKRGAPFLCVWIHDTTLVYW